MTLAALGAVSVLDVGSATVEAAPKASVSPFAGTYVGADPAKLHSGTWTVAISDGGQITSSFSGAERNKGSIGGRVSDDGSYSFTVSVTYFIYDERDRSSRWHTSRYTSDGSMALDLAGDIVGTPDTGGTFVWLRQ